jgi:threonine dehydrogenase-like Zn-dependent dehydrogenase
VAGDVGGQRVLVMGPGTIGQGIALLARHGGAAQVVVSGFDDAVRLDALGRMGFDACIDVKGCTLAEAAAPFTGGQPFDVVFEATGVPETIAEALPLLRRQQQLRGSFRPPESDWPRVLELMRVIGPAMAPMVSHVLPLSQAAEGFALAHGKRASKVLLRPDAGAVDGA